MIGPRAKFVIQKRVRGPWRKYLDHLEPLRPELHRYCTQLTGNLWDGEDLVQDVLLKVFGSLGKTDAAISNPRAYLARAATHLWIDRVRHSNLEASFVQESQSEEPLMVRVPPDPDPLEVNEAAYALLDQLSPQERAAVLMKDVFGFSLQEIASIIKTSTGAVKSALHRGRSRLEGTKPQLSGGASEELVEAFLKSLSELDLDALKSICLEELTCELVGGAVMESLEASQSFFRHAHMEMPRIGFGTNPRWELEYFNDEPLVLGFRTLNGVEGLNEVHRLEAIGGKISRVRCYCFCPDTLRAVAQELGVEALDRPYRSPDLLSATKSWLRSWRP